MLARSEVGQTCGRFGKELDGLGGVERPEREIVEDEQLDAGQPAHLGVEGVVQAGGAEPGEKLVCAGEVDADPAAVAMCPSADARWVLLTPTGPRTWIPWWASVNRRLVRSDHRVRS
jgi:hypothetical protein